MKMKFGTSVYHRLDRMHVSYRSVPKNGHSGDFCAAFALTPIKYGLVLADSSKSGPEAQEQARTICRDLIGRIRQGVKPKNAFQEIALTHLDRDERFATVLYVEVNMTGQKGMLATYRAGHDLPIHIPDKTLKSRRLRRPAHTSLPIGVSDISREVRRADGALNTCRAYEPSFYRIHAGDVVALFSDGITDALDHEGCELDRAGLESMLTSAARRHRSTTAMVDEVFDRLSGYGHRDDMSLMLARIE